MGGIDPSGVHLYNIGVDGSVTESDKYTADGSGFMMALGVLDTLYKKDAPVADGVKLGVQAINAAMQRDAATGEGIDVVTVTKDGVKKVFAKKVDSFVRV
jgi:proteasome beta subunit